MSQAQKGYLVQGVHEGPILGVFQAQERLCKFMQRENKECAYNHKSIKSQR
jgi:hypothetical protein